MCPLCHQRKARRACPALGQQICAVCCGTKRLVEIACPKDCSYLASAREHPPATVVRRQQDDLSSIVRVMRDLNEAQSRLFFLILASIVRYQAPELHPVIDQDVAEAMNALAATYETEVRGVIYDHRPASGSAERLMAALKTPIAEAGKGGGTPFQREAAVVMRRVEAAARDAMTVSASNAHAFLDLVRRVIRPPEEDSAASNLVSL